MISKKALCSLFIFALIFLNSCIGLKADIAVRQEGSGTIELEYRLSRLAESLGRLDGNAEWLTIPIGRADFERTVARVDGLSMRSFSSRNEGNDIVNTVKLEFDSVETLVRFLDATQQRVSPPNQQNSSIFMTLTRGQPIDADLLELFTTVSEGYFININFTAPQDATLTLFNNNGEHVTNTDGITLVPSGRRVSLLSPVGTLLAFREGLSMQLSFR